MNEQTNIISRYCVKNVYGVTLAKQVDPLNQKIINLAPHVNLHLYEVLSYTTHLLASFGLLSFTSLSLPKAHIKIDILKSENIFITNDRFLDFKI